jgi:hypothetical protein
MTIDDLNRQLDSAYRFTVGVIATSVAVTATLLAMAGSAIINQDAKFQSIYEKTLTAHADADENGYISNGEEEQFLEKFVEYNSLTMFESDSRGKHDGRLHLVTYGISTVEDKDNQPVPVSTLIQMLEDYNPGF